MSDEIPLDSTSFNKNYKVLKETADWLSTQKEPDIDQLVPKVEKAMKAYSICKDRLTKVQETLGQYFEESAGGMVQRVTQADPSTDGKDEDDIAF
jgi:exodeoxyribonuclease VII small subunit